MGEMADMACDSSDPFDEFERSGEPGMHNKKSYPFNPDRFYDSTRGKKMADQSQEPKPCKFCGKPIKWTKDGDKSVPLNIDGTLHNKKNGSCKKEEPPETITGQLKSYSSGSVTIVTKGVTKTYALMVSTWKEWQAAGYLIPADNHPDLWLEITLDKNYFVRTYKVVPAPVTQDAAPVQPFKPALELPKDPKYKEKTAKQILQENLDAAAAEKIKNPEPNQTQPVAGQGQPLSSNAPAERVNPQPVQPAQKTVDIEPARELIQNIVNGDPKALAYLAQKEPDLFRNVLAVLQPIRSTLQLPHGIPTLEEITEMVYSYETYWKGKLFLDILTKEDIRQQVEFKNSLSCVELALSTKPADRVKTYEIAWDIYDTIQKKMQEE